MPAHGLNPDGTGCDGLVEPVLDMGVLVGVAEEDVALVDLVPVDSIVGVRHLVGLHPLAVVSSALSPLHL